MEHARKIIKIIARKLMMPWAWTPHANQHPSLPYLNSVHGDGWAHFNHRLRLCSKLWPYQHCSASTGNSEQPGAQSHVPQTRACFKLFGVLNLLGPLKRPLVPLTVRPREQSLRLCARFFRESTKTAPVRPETPAYTETGGRRIETLYDLTYRPH